MDINQVTKKPVNSGRSAWRVVYLQLIIAACMAVGAQAIFSTESARSVLLGSLTIGMPTFVLVKVLFKTHSTNGAKLLRAFYRGEVLKWLLTIVLFILVLRYGHITPAAYFMGLIGGLLAYWAGFFFLYKEEQQSVNEKFEEE